MKSAYAARRGPSFLMVIMFSVFAVLVGGALTIGTLWLLGVELPFLSRPQAIVTAPAVQRSGVPVPLCARAIPAYTRLTREHFLDPKTNDLVVYYLSEEEIKRGGLITDLRELLGRVTTRKKIPAMPSLKKTCSPREPGLAL